MHLLPPLFIFLSTLPLALSTTIPSLPFNQTYLFTATLSLSPPTKPITATGGVIITSALLNGTISGPALNGTITGGLAAPFVTSGQTSTGAKTTLQLPEIYIVGTTSDGLPFFVKEEGVGGSEEQVARLTIDIGGGAKYANLRDGFVLATTNHNADVTAVEVQGWLVENVASFV